MHTARATGAVALALALPLAILLAHASRRWRRGRAQRGAEVAERNSERDDGAADKDGEATSVPPLAATEDDASRWRPHKRHVESVVEDITAALCACGEFHIVDDAGDFELVEVLGQGSFGTAELRRVPSSDGSSERSFIVIKRVPLTALKSWSVGFLVGEVTNGSKLRHPFITRQYGAFLSRHSELCMVLQYAAGGTLWDTVEFQREGERGSLPTGFVTTWLSQLCSAVDYMHQQRVLHRDISTENIFLSYHGDILLGDLGLSRQLTGGSGEIGNTKVGTQVGTPPYMSPELVTGQEYGTSSDVWAVGVVLFEMLALQRPFDGANIVEIAGFISRGEPSQAAQRALEQSGHPPEVLEMASPRGLLHLVPAERTKLRHVLELYPLEANENGEGAEVALDSALGLALRPASSRVNATGTSGITDASAACDMSTSSSADKSSSSDKSDRFHLPADHLAAQLHEGSFRSENSSSTLSSFRHVDSESSRSQTIRSTASGDSRVSELSGSRTGGSTVLGSADQGACGAPTVGVDFSSPGRARRAIVSSSVPRECPTLPATYQARSELCEQLLPRLIAEDAGEDGPKKAGLEGASVLFGMSGTGKTTVAAALVRDPAVARRCVLDDVRDPSHARVLVEALEGATLMVTTPFHHLLPRAHHVHCGLLSIDDSLKLLLQTSALPAPTPDAALEAVELCGRLPLPLALAGAILQDVADSWQRKLIPLLRGTRRRRGHLVAAATEELEATPSAERRVLAASLSLLRSRRQHAPAVLFFFCAAFPEGVLIAASLFDALDAVIQRGIANDSAERARRRDEEKLAKRRAEPEGQPAADETPKGSSDRGSGGGGGGSSQVRPRRCLKVLLDYSLLQGSIREGVMMHDLVRAFAIASTSSEELEALHHAILCTLTTALEPSAEGGTPPSVAQHGELRVYARAHLAHHAAGACATWRLARAEDYAHPIFEIASSHGVEWVRHAVASGVGLTHLQAAAKAAAADAQWMRTCRLWLAAALLPQNEADCCWQAWLALQQEQPTTAASVELEAEVASALVLNKAVRFNSPEHVQLNERLERLCATALGSGSRALLAALDSSRARLHFAALQQASGAQQEAELLHHYRCLLEVAGMRTATQLGATPHAACACAALQQAAVQSTLLHTADGYDWEEDFGADGHWLAELVAWYSTAHHHASFKAAEGRDPLLSGLGSALLLARWGGKRDAAGATAAAWGACVETWTRIAADVQLGTRDWRDYCIELIELRATRAVAIAAGRWKDARRLFDSSPEGAFFTAACVPSASASAERQRQVTDELAAHVAGLTTHLMEWGMDCSWTVASFELLARAMGTLMLLLDPDEKQRKQQDELARASEQWLPPPAQLLNIAQIETAWDVFMIGAQHPALACAQLASQVGRLEEARQVGEGLLHALRQPITRYECHRLLARCAHANGQPKRAQKHTHAAAAEAAAAGYSNLEQLPLDTVTVRQGVDLHLRVDATQPERPSSAEMSRPSGESDESLTLGSLARQAAASAHSRRKDSDNKGRKQVRFATAPVGLGFGWRSHVERVDASRLLRPDRDGVSALPYAKEPPRTMGPSTRSLGTAAFPTDSTEQATSSSFTRSKRSVKSLKLPLGL